MYTKKMIKKKRCGRVTILKHLLRTEILDVDEYIVTSIDEQFPFRAAYL